MSLVNLKASRGQIKAKLTRFGQYFNDLDIINITEAEVSQLKLRVSKVEPLLDEFELIQSNILSQAPEEASSKELEDFEKIFYRYLGDATNIIDKFNQNVVSNTNNSNNSSNSSQCLQPNNYCQLPPVQLPKFNGKYEDWEEFKNSFVSLVDRDSSLSGSRKFFYLKSVLSEEVLEVIKSLQVTDVNYDIAWDLLQKRYENKGLIIHNHIKSIVEHPNLKYESYRDLRSLYDSLNRHLRSLESLGENVKAWDRLILYILAKKFDDSTRRDWETFKYAKELPDMDDMHRFLNNKCDVLEKLEIHKREHNNITKNTNKNTFGKRGSFSQSLVVNNNIIKCAFCQENHPIKYCSRFLQLSVSQRINKIKEKRLCLNCFRNNHLSLNCRSPKCNKCHKPHNILLHLENKTDFATSGERASSLPLQSDHATSCPSGTRKNCLSNDNSVDSDIEITATSVFENDKLEITDSFAQATKYKLGQSQVLLSTAMVNIINNGQLVPARALLDSGSTSNFIREDFCDKIGLNKSETSHVVTGIGQNAVKLNMHTNISITSNYNVFSKEINCLIIPKITDRLPRITFDNKHINIPNSFHLADPNYNISNEIDLLLGSQVFWEVMRHGQYQLGENMPMLQNTALGWVIAGNLKCNSNKNIYDNSVSFLSINEKIDMQISKFWAIEELTNKIKILSDSEKYCELNFENSTKRDINGRFIVSIPFKDSLPKLGNSKEMALKRFHSLENKLMKNESLRQEYVSFMEEYKSLEHMREIDLDSKGLNGEYFLPHHVVIKSTSVTTKYRVVFDASAKTDSGLSLNDVQFVGPALQNDIFSILVRFRKFQYVMTADISKMYRQILINDSHKKYQKIFWRATKNEPLKAYELNTVTYGCAAAPYLAVRCILQLAEDNKLLYPKESKIITNSFYIDDLLTGADSVEELIELQKNISNILLSAGFELRKWLSNDINILNNFLLSEHLPSSVLRIGENDSTNKTLGIFWDARGDTIKYSLRSLDNNITQISKRQILSLVCQIYDPLGLLGPVIILAKILLQDLWKIACPWDEKVPQNIFNKWLEFQKNLTYINNISIPRYACLTNYVTIELHGFADASIKAYGACLYIRCVNETKNIISVNLLCSKTRVAPIQHVTLPRLELSACLLLANLTKKTLDSLEIDFTHKYFWTDSSVTLAWLKGDISKWKTFVANRVSEINSLINKNDWYHIRTNENPADMISRGCTGSKLCESQLWWQGPEWLRLPKCKWVISNINFNFEVPDQKSNTNISLVVNIEDDNSFKKLIERHSNINKLVRVCAYILRFVNNIKNKKQNKDINKEKITSPSERENALLFLIKTCQIQSFREDYNMLLENKPLNKRSKLLCLNPFIHESTIRVGGRLIHSDLKFDKKHQIILPKGHHLTQLILRNEHCRLLHCGVQQLIYSIRDKFWPISARNSCKNIVKKCVVCFRAKPQIKNYLMGNLPDYRVQPSSPFTNVGVDYAGPVMLKDRQTRNAKLIKGYICLFICMSTKCIHLELVTDLSTASFMSTFKRFISRRGKPSNIFSDNGRNFVGANSEIEKLYNFLEKESKSLGESFSNERIKWHFIPARSPSFGGLWESGIKSAKFHLNRVLQGQSLTYEHFSTLLTEVEGILNSRPLCQLFNDPEDLNALTPAHFLIGRSMTALPEVNLQHVPENRLDKYQKLQAMLQSFWQRWRKEYLNELQTRVKWRQNASSLKIGSLVLLKEENAPTFQWQLGRVTALHPGSDSVVRVVEIKAQSGVFRRAVTKVCPLPIE